MLLYRICLVVSRRGLFGDVEGRLEEHRVGGVHHEIQALFRRLEGEGVVLQGDQVARLVPWLEKAGARVVKG